MESTDYNDLPCPECGHKIGVHMNSIFGHNPSNRKGLECSRSYNSLLIEKLTVLCMEDKKSLDLANGTCESLRKQLRVAKDALEIAVKEIFDYTEGDYFLAERKVKDALAEIRNMEEEYGTR